MNTVLLIFLCVFEAAFAVTAIRRKADKKGWQTGRLICNAGQLCVYLIMLIAPGIDLSFRFMGLFVLLLIRIIISLIAMLICRRRETKSKHPAAIVISALVSVVLITVSLAPSYLITDYSGIPASGEYKVAQANAILIDESRTEEYETDGSKREVPIYFYYPAIASEDGRFPLVIFSHGAFGYYQSNHSTYEELASNGYVVLSVEHPYHSLYTNDTDGKTIIVDSEFMSGINIINSDGVSEETVFRKTSKWLKLRCDDISFVIDSVKYAAGDDDLPGYWYVQAEQSDSILAALSMADTDRIGVMGHSLGGAAAVTLGRTRTDISAVIDLDGTMKGEVTGVENDRDIVNSEPYTTPLLSFDNEEHHFAAIEAREAGIPYANNIIHDNAECGFRTYVAGTGHMNYTDLPMYSPALAGMLGTGTVDPAECMTEVNRIVLEFFDSFLKGKGEFIVRECIDVS